MSYDALARYYDALMSHVDYTPWLTLLEQHLQPGDLVLDAACGTGTLALLLAQRGYSVIGADASPAMLAEARQKASIPSQAEPSQAEPSRAEPSHVEPSHAEPLFLCQRIEELDLYGTVKAAVCSLDGMNYITKPEVFIRAVSRIFLFLEPDGVFLFDVKTPKALAAMHRQSHVMQTDEVFCVWETHCRKPHCYHDITLFALEGHLWRRYDERHVQRAYPIEWIARVLRDTGFSSVKIRKDLLPEHGRVFYVCKK